MDNKLSFEEIFEQNERRIHYQIHKMNIRDPHQEFFQEGLVALWNAYETYQPDKGHMATYFNYMSRNRLRDYMRRENRPHENQQQAIQAQKIQDTDGNHHRGTEASNPIVNERSFPLDDASHWKHIKSQLTENQWKWVYGYIIQEMPYKEIAEQENTTVDAVKSWGKQVRKKLKNTQLREIMLMEDSRL